MPHARVCFGRVAHRDAPVRSNATLGPCPRASEPTSGIVILSEILGICNRYANPSRLVHFRSLLSYAHNAGNFEFAHYSYVISVFPCASQPKPFKVVRGSTCQCPSRSCPSERNPPSIPFLLRDIRSAILRAATHARCSLCLLFNPHSKTYRYGLRPLVKRRRDAARAEGARTT